jgi:hypothetical protein
VRKGLLQVYVRVKPVARKLARCMAIERDALVRATWCGAPGGWLEAGRRAVRARARPPVPLLPPPAPVPAADAAAPPHPPATPPPPPPPPLVMRPPPLCRKNKEALYKFSKVFPEDASQGALYAGVGRPLVADLLAGRAPHGVIMAYGVTSAGKTFTMQVGPAQPRNGMICLGRMKDGGTRPNPPGAGGARLASRRHRRRQPLPLSTRARARPSGRASCPRRWRTSSSSCRLPAVTAAAAACASWCRLMRCDAPQQCIPDSQAAAFTNP